MWQDVQNLNVWFTTGNATVQIARNKTNGLNPYHLKFSFYIQMQSYVDKFLSDNWYRILVVNYCLKTRNNFKSIWSE